MPAEHAPGRLQALFQLERCPPQLPPGGGPTVATTFVLHVA
jgi:hypothetical protein